MDEVKRDPSLYAIEKGLLALAFSVLALLGLDLAAHQISATRSGTTGRSCVLQWLERLRMDFQVPSSGPTVYRAVDAVGAEDRTVDGSRSCDPWIAYYWVAKSGEAHKNPDARPG